MPYIFKYKPCIFERLHLFENKKLTSLIFLCVFAPYFRSFFRCNSKIPASINIKTPQKQYQENFVIIRIMFNMDSKKYNPIFEVPVRYSRTHNQFFYQYHPAINEKSRCSWNITPYNTGSLPLFDFALLIPLIIYQRKCCFHSWTYYGLRQFCYSISKRNILISSTEV